MSKQIWKYEMQRGLYRRIQMPKDPQFLDVQMQHGRLALWVLVETDNDREERGFLVVGTGATFEDYGATYIGTAQDGNIVWHVFGYR